eukprot:RCo004309
MSNGAKAHCKTVKILTMCNLSAELPGKGSGAAVGLRGKDSTAGAVREGQGLPAVASGGPRAVQVHRRPYPRPRGGAKEPERRRGEGAAQGSGAGGRALGGHPTATPLQGLGGPRPADAGTQREPREGLAARTHQLGLGHTHRKVESPKSMVGRGVRWVHPVHLGLKVTEFRLHDLLISDGPSHLPGGLRQLPLGLRELLLQAAQPRKKPRRARTLRTACAGPVRRMLRLGLLQRRRSAWGARGTGGGRLPLRHHGELLVHLVRPGGDGVHRDVHAGVQLQLRWGLLDHRRCTGGQRAALLQALQGDGGHRSTGRATRCRCFRCG